MALLFTWLVLVFGIGSPTVANLSNSQAEISSWAYTAAVNEGVNPVLFLKLCKCESNISFAHGDYRSETDEFMAHGPMQWWKSSFDFYSKKYNYLGNYWSSYSQIGLAAIVISREKDGWRNWYNCWREINE